MRDPYEVLGVSPSATDEEVKNAYRALARKYHPDNYADNPLADLAGEKMQEINEAYDAIVNSRKGGNNGYAGSSGSSYADIRNMIAAGKLEEALEILDGVPVASRNAEWYFLNGSVLYRRGWLDGAFASFSNACRMDPNNAEYRQALNRMQKQNTRGRYANPYSSGSNYGGSGACNMDPCTTLCCADLCCESLGGNLIPCIGCR
ncbi:MAG: J domain-containing protein [Clostridiales bacterium]|nr:J domain-containing protein [Candidatus Equinaster intestinalis]